MSQYGGEKLPSVHVLGALSDGCRGSVADYLSWMLDASDHSTNTS